MTAGHFTVTARDGAARAGFLRTAHGQVPTPAFMPVGTKATVKLVDPEELRTLGASIVLGNTYHLHFRPGEDVVAELDAIFTAIGAKHSQSDRENATVCQSFCSDCSPGRSPFSPCLEGVVCRSDPHLF